MGVIQRGQMATASLEPFTVLAQVCGSSAKEMENKVGLTLSCRVEDMGRSGTPHCWQKNSASGCHKLLI